MDPFIPKRRGTPNLDRRLAKKNIDYMSSTFSSSDAAPPPSSLRTRSLDISPLGNKTSFRIQGIDGEFDEICSSLGLCGPEDFSIAATAPSRRKCPPSRKGPSALDRSRLHQIEIPTGVDNMRSWFPFIDGVRSDDVRSNLKMAAPVSNQKILNDDETVDGGLMAPCRRGESADSEISSESVCSFVDSMTSISSTDSDALDNRAHLERAYHSGPIVFNSEKKDTREGLSGECLTKSALSFDDSTKRKSLPVDVNLSSFSEHASQDFDDFDFFGFWFKKKDFVGFDYGAGMLPNLKDELDSSREKPLVDFDTPNIKAHGLLVSNSEEKNTREASTRRCMTESVCSLVDSMPSISSTDFDALDNRSHLGRAYQSGPIVFNSEQKDTREGLSGQWLIKSAPSFDDKQKLLSDVRILASSLELRSQDLYDVGDFDGFDHCAGRLPNFEDEFNDGLLSSCGDEPIILSTTNCRDQHDAALLPFVNMDTYIHMPSPQSIGKVVQLESSEQKPLEPLGRGCCDSMELEQPGTLEELGMDPENEGIISDFLGFVRKKESCKKVGKAWTRFYMLYEPPGTHRSSLIAAMANYLKFDIYDLDLTSLSSIRELQDMLFSTMNRSLIAIRDFDHCATKLPILENELTVSLLSVYVDDLMSTCGDERIIIFTTNHRNRYDAALLHPVNVDTYIQNTSPQPLALPDEGETVQIDSSEHKPLVDFDATSIRTYKSGVLVSNSEKKSTGGVSKRRRMTKSVPSFHAPDNGAHLVGVHQTTSSMELDQPENEGIISDLLGFLRDKEFYKRIGKAWKRGYLLYDSPCTDRSSLIAVMANCLEFDIYDLDLTGVSSISELTNVLVSVRNRSVIAIKDFDRWFAMLPNLKNELTISGLMKIIHGFLSSCGDEQIVILTTHHNHVDRVDATLLRPLRFDLYIHKSSPQPKALPDGGEIVLLDSSEQKPYVDFDATNNRACQSNVLVSNSEEKNMREASRRQCMPEGVLSLVDSAIRISSMLTKKNKGISSTNFDAPDNSAQLVRAYQSGPIVFNSEKDDMGDVSNRECFTKSVLTLDDSSVQKSLLDVDITENESHLVRACQSGSFMSLSDNKNRGEALKITKSILGLEGLQQISRGRRDDAAKSFCGIHTTDSLALISFEVLETLPTWEQPNDCVPLLSLGRLTLEDCVQQEKSPDLPRVMQMNGVEQRVTKLPRYLGVRTPQSASSSHWPIGLPDGGHIVLLDPLDQYTTNIKHAARADQCSPTESRAKKKMVRKTLKRMCRTMSVKFEENHQLFARRCKGDTKSLGAMRIFRKHGINQVSPVKRIHKQQGISQWPFRQKWATRKGYSLGDERPFEVSSLSMDEKLDSRLQFIHRSKSARSSPRALTLPDGGEIVRPVTLSLSEFAATNNRAHLVGQDQSGSTASHYECKNARETSDKQGFEDPERHFGCKDKDVVKSLGVSVSMFKSTCWQHWVYCWPNRFENNEQQAFDATNNRAHLVKADESSPTVSTSEKGSMREALKRDCLTNALSLEDLRQHFGASHKDAVKGLCYSPTWKSFEVLDSLPLGERSNSTRHLARQRTLMPEHCVQLKKSQDLLRSPQRDCSGGLAPQSDISLPDGGHILSLSEKKIVRKTLKRKCRSMSVLSLEDHKQHVDKRWEDAAKSHGAKRICRQLVIHRISTAKRIRKQHGIHRWPFQRSAVGLPDGHILPLSEKKIFRTILKRKFRSMNVLRLVDRKQHVDRRWEDAAKNIGAKRICRQLVIHRVSIAKRRQHGIHHRWPFQQDWATMKGYSLGDKRPVEVISLSMCAKFVSRLQLIYISWLGRFSLRPSALTGGGEVGGPIALSLSESAATKNIAQRVGQDKSGFAASDSENERTREQEDLEEIYTSITSDDLRRLYGRMNRKDAAASLGVSISTFKRKCREYGIKPWPHIRRKKAVLRPPDQHGEKNPPSTCKTLSTNGQTEMENEMVGHLAEMNEFLLDFDDGSNEAGVSSEWAYQLRNQWTVSTAHPNSSGLVVPHPHMVSQILGENMGSLEEWGNSFASLEEPLLPSHDSGSMSTVPPCSYPVPSQPMPTIPHTLGSSEDRRNSLAFLEDVFPEEHVSGSLLASVEDVSLEEHVHTMGSLLASAEEHFSVGHGFGFINQIVPSCFDPAPSQSMPNTLHTMPQIPHMMPLLTERQDTRSVMLKATYGDITIKFQLPLTCGIGKLKEEVSKRLECEPGSYHVEYKDEDGTWIIINCDEDVRIFLDLFTSLRNQVIELRVRDKVPNTTKFCQCGRSLKRKRP